MRPLHHAPLLCIRCEAPTPSPATQTRRCHTVATAVFQADRGSPMRATSHAPPRRIRAQHMRPSKLAPLLRVRRPDPLPREQPVAAGRQLRRHEMRRLRTAFIKSCAPYAPHSGLIDAACLARTATATRAARHRRQAAAAPRAHLHTSVFL